ncbi:MULTISPECIES: 23S ribosomal RNA methyltransferase Erm [Nocardia]|uniref:23S ribosomal RNA methyltransferase Erm n=1 Tax=Nocardia TaxID=1817 RepID=UPI00135BBE0E|nr:MULTISPECIES: 23S ribosomal RNA methyltransferase Erm [Nocardia]
MSRHRSLSHARDSGSHPAATRKRLSQNFLIDASVARLIVRASGVTADDLVLEIGPGDGMLTRQLLAAAGRVHAYEKDPRYATLLRRRYADDPRIRLYQGDFREARPPREPFAVVANVPFAITTDIVRWCLAARGLTSATLLTQLEFARKHSGYYGRWTKLTVGHWPTTAIRLGAQVGRHSFHPVPQVDTAILRLRTRPDPLLPGEQIGEYRNVVELGFSGVGGSLAASLRREFPSRAVRRACEKAGVSLEQPVGLVSPDRWLTLYRALRA